MKKGFSHVTPEPGGRSKEVSFIISVWLCKTICMHLSVLKILEWAQKGQIGAISGKRHSDVVMVVLAVKVRREGEQKYSCIGATEFFIHIDTFEEVTRRHFLKGKLNDLHSNGRRILCTGLSVVSELLEILWLCHIVLLLTVMKLCHVTVAEALTLELAKDKMPFDLMWFLFTVICLYIQSKNTSIYLCMFSKSSHFILLLGSLINAAKIKWRIKWVKD